MVNSHSAIETKFWHFFLSKYLEVSIRLGSYTSIYFFSKVIDPAWKQMVNSDIWRNILYFLWGILLFELIHRIVIKLYRPKFISFAEAERQKQLTPENVLVLSETDYVYRTRMEKLIMELAIYYLFHLFLAIDVLILGRLPLSFIKEISIGFFGGFISLFNFWGVALLLCIEQIKDRIGKITNLFIGTWFILPQIVYIGFVLFKSFFQ